MHILLYADFSIFNTLIMDYHNEHGSKTSLSILFINTQRLTSKPDKITVLHSKQLRKLNIDSFFQKKQGPLPSFSIKGKELKAVLAMAAEKDKTTTEAPESMMPQ